MHDDKAPCRLRNASIAVCALALAAYAWAMPAPGRLMLGPPRLLYQEGQDGWLLPPGCECLTEGTGPWDARDDRALGLQTPPERATT